MESNHVVGWLLSVMIAIGVTSGFLSQLIMDIGYAPGHERKWASD